jgi:hypothetical protein
MGYSGDPHFEYVKNDDRRNGGMIIFESCVWKLPLNFVSLAKSPQVSCAPADLILVTGCVGCGGQCTSKLIKNFLYACQNELPCLVFGSF